MLSIFEWEQVYPNWQVLNYSSILNKHLSYFTDCCKSVIVVKLAWPRATLFGSAYCICKKVGCNIT